MWKDIEFNPEVYEINEVGDVRNKKTGRILKPRKNRNGYLQVILCKDGKRKTFLVHRLVAIAFIPNPENKRTVNHKDENKTNNCVENLQWMTDKENTVYSEAIPIEAYKNGELIGVFESQIECARQLGLSQGNIWGVLNGIKPHTKGYTFKNHV